jgi:hypothetical protein
MNVERDAGGNLIFPDAEDQECLRIATHSYILEKFSECQTLMLSYLSQKLDEGRKVPLQVPYEDIVVHPDNYYNTSSYGEDLIEDPFQVPFMKLFDMASALRKDPFQFYDPRDIDTRRQALVRARLTSKDDSTLGTGAMNDILDISDDGEGICRKEGDRYNGSDDGSIMLISERSKLAGRESEEYKPEDDELDEDENTMGEGRSLLKEYENCDVDEDENATGQGRSLLKEDENLDIDELEDAYRKGEGKSPLQVDENVEDENMMGEGRSLLKEDENRDVDELEEDKNLDVDELEEDKNLDVDELEEDKNLDVDELKDENKEGEGEGEGRSMNIDQPEEEENDMGKEMSLLEEHENENEKRECTSAGGTIREALIYSYLSFLIPFLKDRL